MATKKKFGMKDFWMILKKTFKVWNAKDPFRESSVIAYYSIFSIPALLVIVIAVAGMFFGRENVNDYLVRQMSDAIGSGTAVQVKSMVIKASDTGNSMIASIIGFITLLLGATGVFAQLQKSLNIIWEVKADPKKENIWATIRTRLFSFGLIVSIGFLLLISLVITSVLALAASHIRQIWPEGISFMFYVINFLASFGAIAVLFAMLFKVLPDVHIHWRYVRLGAIVTAFLFVLGKFALGIYFGSADPGSVYGAAGSVILILIWVSYSSMILFFGAEFTKIYSDFFELSPRPKSIAVKTPRRGKDLS
ncbi:MAG: YihY/virulence factor BrkB family protein [Ignavibacteriota bacterium]